VLSAAQRQEELLGEEIESVAGEKPAGSVRNASRASEKDVICYRCSEKGHMAKACPKKDSTK
jgi:Zinc knuckle